MSKFVKAAVLLGGVMISSAAFAHATLETVQATAGSYYKAVIRVGHGCKAEPTLKVRLRIPDGVVSVKPMPKAGWTLTITEGPLKTPASDGHGGQISKGVTEVVWTGSLPDAHYDEFVVRGKLPDTAGVIHWPVVQECATGAHRWIEVPVAGQKSSDLSEPAPALTIIPKP